MLKTRDYLKFLNENCPIDEEWVADEKLYTIRIHKDVEDKISEWVEKIVGCSFFYELDDEDYLNLKITKSTLEDNLQDNLVKKLYDYIPVKIDRFGITKGRKGAYDEHWYYIIDKLKFIESPARWDDPLGRGVIFAASSASEWVNYDICAEVLEKLNKDESIINMMDYCRNKK